jgi:hypothetical protein
MSIRLQVRSAPSGKEASRAGGDGSRFACLPDGTRVSMRPLSFIYLLRFFVVSQEKMYLGYRFEPASKSHASVPIFHYDIASLARGRERLCQERIPLTSKQRYDTSGAFSIIIGMANLAFVLIAAPPPL